jgi:ketosteroid isomerase-like protein
MNVEENKRIAEADVLCVGPETLERKLSHYDDNPTVWDSVIRVLGYSENNTVSGFEEVKKFFTWLAGLPPIKMRVLNVFGEGDKVAVEWLLLGGEGTQKFEIPCANLYDFENGKIKSVRMQFDSAYFAEIVGK